MGIFVKHKKLRQEIKELLELLPESNQKIFKRTYSHHENKPINEIVDELPNNKVKWAFQQVLNTHMNNL